MPKLNCQWAGVSTVPGSWVMLNALCTPGVIIHELGHNYGLYHSNVLLPSGTNVPYLDYSCAMGVGTGGGNDAKCYSLPQVRACRTAGCRVTVGIYRLAAILPDDGCLLTRLILLLLLQMHALGIARPTVVTANSLPVGGSALYTLGVTWSGNTQGLSIDIASFGGAYTNSHYYVSLQADSGPQVSRKDISSTGAAPFPLPISCCPCSSRPVKPAHI